MGLPEFDADDPVSIYIHLAKEVKPLTPEEEAVLLHQLLTGDAQADSAEKRLVEGNLLPVVNIAMRHRSSGIHVLDLIEAGNNGLFTALKTFAGSSSEAFSAHAATCVEQAIAKRIAQGDQPRILHRNPSS